MVIIICRVLLWCTQASVNSMLFIVQVMLGMNITVPPLHPRVEYPWVHSTLLDNGSQLAKKIGIPRKITNLLGRALASPTLIVSRCAILCLLRSGGPFTKAKNGPDPFFYYYFITTNGPPRTSYRGGGGGGGPLWQP